MQYNFNVNRYSAFPKTFLFFVSLCMFSMFRGEEKPVSELGSFSCLSFSFLLFSLESRSFLIRINFFGVSRSSVWIIVQSEYRKIINFSPSAGYPGRKPSRRPANPDYCLPQVGLDKIPDTGSPSH